MFIQLKLLLDKYACPAEAGYEQRMPQLAMGVLSLAVGAEGVLLAPGEGM